MWFKGGAGKLKFLSHWACLLSPVGSEICNVPAVWISKNHSEGIDTFDVGVQSIQRSAKRLALHQSEVSPSIVGRSLSLWQWRNLAKNLKMTTTTLKGPRGEFYFIIITKVLNRFVSVQYVVCSPITVVLNLTEFLSSTVWRSFHSLAAK